MFSFIHHTVEYQQWGYNLATFSAVAVAGLTFIELYALFVQGTSVWRQRSGESLNVLLVAYPAFLSFATAVYGLEIKSITLIWNGGSAGFLGVLVLGGLYRFKQFSKTEQVLVPMFVLLPIIMFLPQRQLFYAIRLFGFAVAAFMQLLELLASKSRGVVELRFLGVYVLLDACWIAFGIGIHDWAVWVPHVLLGSVFLATIVAWYRARP